MKILVISQQWYPEDGTPQRRFRQLTRHAIESGHELQVIAAPPHYPGGKLTTTDPSCTPGAVATGVDGETVWRSNFSEHSRSLTSRVKDQAVVAFSSWRIARRLAKRWKPDIIVTTAPPLPQVFTTAAVAKEFRIPYLVDLRDVWPDILAYMNEWGVEAEANPKNPAKGAAFSVLGTVTGLLFKRALRGASGIVTTTPSFAEKLRSQGYKRVLSVRNIASVRDKAVPTIQETEFLDGRDREPGSLRVLYAGTTGRAQGLEVALEALRLAVDAGVDMEMRVVGSGSHLRLMKLQAQRHQLPVTFLGRIPYEDVIDDYEWCDTTLVQLRDWEPLEYTVPSKLYEALSLGRHVSGSLNGESARIIQETGAGDVTAAMDPNALADLWISLAHNRERLEVGDRGRSWLLDRDAPEENAAKFTSFMVQLVSEQNRQGKTAKRNSKKDVFSRITVRK